MTNAWSCVVYACTRNDTTDGLPSHLQRDTEGSTGQPRDPLSTSVAFYSLLEKSSILHGIMIEKNALNAIDAHTHSYVGDRLLYSFRCEDVWDNALIISE